ncbi:MAG: Calx-beta domain-containing protein, partial [Aquihabitans sp.]
TNAAGTAAVPHPQGTQGIVLGGKSTLNVAIETNSASTTVKDNLISGNPGFGVAVPQVGNLTLTGNLIGTDATGTLPLGNTGVGVAVQGSSAHVQVGGTGAGEANVIAATKSVNIVGYTDGDGIAVQSGATATIQGNLIGTNAAGAAGLGNQGSGIDVVGNGSSATVGGTGAGEGNTIVGGGIGLRVRGAPAGQTVQATVQGNRFGTNPAGTAKAGNGGVGILVECGGKIAVGGTAPGAANVISGHQYYGISMCDGRRGSTIQGNRIGTNAAGTAAIANGYGIRLTTPDDTSTFGSTPLLIGGTTAGAGNLLSGNTQQGAQLTGTVSFQGNVVGLDAAGTAAIPNGFAGLDVYGNAAYGAPTIGGSAAGAGNVISGNVNSGITATLNGFVIQGNRIGTNAAGTALIGNEFAGVFIQNVTTATIGGIGAGEGNTIAGNGHEGVFVLPNASGVVIRGNRIFDNTRQSIELFQYSPEGGGNNDQTPPTMTATAGGAQTAVSGTVKTDVAGPVTIDVYASDHCGPEGSGESRERLGTLTVNHPGGGTATPFSGNVALPSSGNTVITATATVAVNGTSQFSHCAVVTDLDAKAVPNATSVPVGDDVGTLLSITNNGPTAATGVVMELEPNTGQYSAADVQVHDPPTKGTISGTTWNVGALAVGETASVCTYQTAVRATIEYTPGFPSPAAIYPGLKVASANPGKDPYTGNDEWTGGTRIGPRQAGANVCVSPTLSIGDATLTRPTSGTATMTFPVTLSKVGGRPVTVAYTTQNGTAAAVIDYEARSGTVTIPAGQTTASIQVPIVGNQSDEPDKAFQVVLS